jgi:hypothetical protein
MPEFVLKAGGFCIEKNLAHGSFLFFGFA